MFCERPTARLALLFTLLFAVLTTVLDPPRADADHGALRIGGIRSGMTGHQVKAQLGGPQRRSTRSRGGRPFEWQWHYPGRLTVGFERFAGTRRVFRVRTRSPRDAFEGAVHVGSKEAVMRRIFIGETCEFNSQRYETMPRGFTCEWGGGGAGFVCGPRWIFYMHRRHGRIGFIELWGMQKRYLLRPSPRLAHPLTPIAMRGCF